METKIISLKETCQIIKKWVESCTTPDQLNLLKEVVHEFIEKRFFDDPEVIYQAASVNVLI